MEWEEFGSPGQRTSVLEVHQGGRGGATTQKTKQMQKNNKAAACEVTLMLKQGNIITHHHTKTRRYMKPFGSHLKPHDKKEN